MVTSMRLLLFSSVTLVAPTCTVVTNTSHALQLACMTVHVYIVQMKAKRKNWEEEDILIFQIIKYILTDTL